MSIVFGRKRSHWSGNPGGWWTVALVAGREVIVSDLLWAFRCGRSLAEVATRFNVTEQEAETMLRYEMNRTNTR